MKLYHGTSERHLESILRDGIHPRSKRKGNWTHTVNSANGVVYLTNAYAIFFAECAVKGDERGVVLEIDTNKLSPFDLVPDEDALAQAFRHNAPDRVPTSQWLELDLIGKTKWFRKKIKNYADGEMWKRSIEYLGNCGHLGIIPPHAITRYAIIGDGAHTTRMAGMDPTISAMNYYMVGCKYRNMLRWLFNDGGYEEDNFGDLWLLPEEERQHITVKECVPA